MGVSEEAMPACREPQACPFEALIHEMGASLREMSASLSRLAEDVAVLKASAAAGAPWRAGIMWLIGLLVAALAFLHDHFAWR